MTDYLDLEDLVVIARQVVGENVAVRDYGLLVSAVERPRATVFGEDAYPDLHFKAAALMQSLSRNHSLVDGNKRLAWAACRVFLAINECRIRAPEDDRFNFVIAVATGTKSDLGAIAEQLRAWTVAER